MHVISSFLLGMVILMRPGLRYLLSGDRIVFGNGMGLIQVIGGSLTACLAVVLFVRAQFRTLEIVLDADTVELPNMYIGKGQRIPIASITSIKRSSALWFAHMLYIVYQKDGRKRTKVIQRNLVGKEAFSALCQALGERSLTVA